MRKLLILGILALPLAAGCGTLGAQLDARSPFGVKPVLTTGELDADVPVNEAVETFLANRPTNPVDYTGWIYAATAAIGAGGLAFYRRRLLNLDPNTPIKDV